MKKTLVVTALMALATLGSQAAVTWYWNPAPADVNIKNQITTAMNNACYHYTQNSGLSRNVPVKYNASVPTANASYLGTITFGGSRQAYIAHHEMAHVFGVGTYQPTWNNKCRSDNTWPDAGANNQYKAFDGQGAVLHTQDFNYSNGGGGHFWNYGMNYGWEDDFRHVKIVIALRHDMGL